MSTGKEASRNTRLQTLFATVLNGKENITTRNAKLFLEAIVNHPHPATCIQRLVANPCGLSALASSLSSDNAVAFFNGPVAAFIHYLRAPDLKIVCGGEVLRQIVIKVVETPITWDSFVKAARSADLEHRALESFAWLLLETLCLPTDISVQFLHVAKDSAIQKRILESSHVETRLLGQRIAHIACTLSVNSTVDEQGPGGRHDNDFGQIRDISVLPTPDELRSRDPYLPRASDLENKFHSPEGLAFYIDGQFRLLREDMLRDLREEIGVSLGRKVSRRKPFIIENLTMAGIRCDGRKPWSVQFQCLPDLPQLANKKGASRKQFFVKNTGFLKHESLACLMVDGDIATLTTIVRDEDMLARSPPELSLQIPVAAVESALLRIKTATQNIKLVQLSTALFAYEPVLKQLKETKELSLEADIIRWKQGNHLSSPNYRRDNAVDDLVQKLERHHSLDLQDHLNLPSSTKLDESQALCLQAGLKQRLTLIQGPPGTGKSFIGSLLAKAIYTFSTETILVVCYTHHALDQFVDDLLKLGIAKADVVRLGSTKKSSAQMRALSLPELRTTMRLTGLQHAMIDNKKEEISDESKALQLAFSDFSQTRFSKTEILEYLEFLSGDLPYFEALSVPNEEMTRVGRKGKAVDQFYLLDRWFRGKDAGMFRRARESEFQGVWKMLPKERIKRYNEWKEVMLKERVIRIRDLGKPYDSSLEALDAIFMEKDLNIIRQKRIIACTTTAAAKYGKALQSIAPGILLVEEAGEILESHILTALGPNTEQLILIGDHKQLRPKVHHDLSVEKGDGFDLNRSLFERLILQDYPHQVLLQQHRMRPEISALVRELTYADLVDAPKTKSKPKLRGFTDNLIFVNHREHETDMVGVPDFVDNTSVSSKRNLFEAEMTLKCVRYLGQQGYRTDNIAVLTPYLGQLRLLLDQLAKDNDPVLNDLDSHDLVRAGLMPAATASVGKPRIRISTIDNFQGDESDVVVISLTRSNPQHDIGFMYSPERLNVLLSRARDGLILIGNADTFMQSRKGGELWKRLFAMLKRDSHIYDGFPVLCERHKDRRTILRKPGNFDTECPDGGCREPCGSKLSCGAHLCPQRCHQLFDHSKMQCEKVVESKCANSHSQRRKCFQSPLSVCQQCVMDDERRQKELEIELQIQKKRDAAQKAHAAKMAELDREIKLARAEAADSKLATEQSEALAQKQKDLEIAKQLLQSPSQTSEGRKSDVIVGENDDRIKHGTHSPNQKHAKPSRSKKKAQPETKSASELEWERQKRVENASNDAIDALMKLTGLEQVKAKILDIKAKVEIVARQGTDMKKERYGMVMLGNPGTGKTTVARLYGQFLASVQAIPGRELIETTGASLANDGVPGAKKMIENLIKGGGGVFFLDEAYQLASGNSYNGKAVLDFLLAEIEERRGTVVFILAGYRKEMEKFFEHNSGFDSRMPHQLTFADFSDEELREMFVRMVEVKYTERAVLEDGPEGLYARILVTRLGRRRGTEGYGNARALENVWSVVTERQASRIRRERSKGTRPDDLLFTKEDLIGPEPSHAVQESEAWKELNDLIGLKSVKEAVKALLDGIRLNYLRELEGIPPLEVSLNRVFLGSPGTGKTTVAKLYGAILADLGLLSKGEVVMKNPADLVGSALGESEKNTKAILKTTEGKVLLIDEAYMLSSGPKGGSNAGDPYRTAVIDTMVAEIQGTPGEDRCVLLLGYREQMAEMLRNANPGLARRFPLDAAFHFDDFSDSELRQVLDLKLKKQGIEATNEAKDIAIAVLSRARDRPNFGNAGAVENLLSMAKESWQKRASLEAANPSAHVVLSPRDFNEDFDRVKSSATNVKKLFSDIVGCEQLVDKLQSYQRVAASLKARRKDPRDYVPFNFIFKGPPGTGKTTVARKMAELFYEIGLLPTTELSECSAADLVAQFVGQSAPKTREVLKSALGQVLFVDEAYRLREGEFGKEAVNEMVDCLTKPEFMGKLVVILAGYTDDMNALLGVNPGLSSRFPEEVVFQNMKPHECLVLLKRQLQQAELEVASVIDEEKSVEYRQLMSHLEQLIMLPSWGNGRDIKTLSKKIAAASFECADTNSSRVKVSTADILRALKVAFTEQKARSQTMMQNKVGLGDDLSRRLLAQTADASPAAPMKIDTTYTTVERKQDGPESAELPKPDQKEVPLTRDPNVSDKIWEQLQRDAEANQATERAMRQALEAGERAAQQLQEKEALTLQEIRKTEQAMKEKLAAGEEIDELKRRFEQQRLQDLAIKRARDGEEARLRKLREEDEKRRQQEARAQKKLKDMGVCPVGFRWIKQAGGYRCSGGAHFVSDSQLGV